MIAIISISASILFPVFARARENARRASCQSNEKQLSLALFMYTQDHDGRFSQYNYCTTSEVGCWYYAALSYYKNPQILRGLDAGTGHSQAALYSGGQVHNNNFVPTYDMNGYGGCGLYIYTGRLLSSIDSPSTTWMLVEQGDPHYYYSNTYNYGFSYSTLCSSASPEASTYWLTYHGGTYAIYNGRPSHLGGSNIAYADGHVKRRKDYASVADQNWQAR